MPQPAKSSSPKPAAAVAAAKPAAIGKGAAPTERAKMIADAAYFIAQKRGFGGGKEREDWLAAEKQVDELLKKRG